VVERGSVVFASLPIMPFNAGAGDGSGQALQTETWTACYTVLERNFRLLSKANLRFVYAVKERDVGIGYGLGRKP
jgi:asparagine N-glycosylation enzyme membrane subunit Stt3